jgi:hypothetical protein
MSARVCIYDRVVCTIRKQIISRKASASVDKTIRIDKSTPGGVVIAGLEVVVAGFSGIEETIGITLLGTVGDTKDLH